MILSATTILLIIALLCFLLAAFNVTTPVNLTAFGLAFCVIAAMVH